MTSTPRSQHSSRSTLPWRTYPKNRAPTSLSFIVATPEVVPPLASAVAHLPSIKMASDGDTQTTTTSTPVEDPAQATSEAKTPLDHDDEPYPMQVQPPSPTNNTDAASIPDPVAAETAPEPAGPISTPAPTLVSQSRGWLASLSRRPSSNAPLNGITEQPPPPSLPSEQSESATETRPSHSSASDTILPPDELADSVPADPSISEPRTVNASQSEVATKMVPRKRTWFASSSSFKQPSKLRHADESLLPVMDMARMDPPASETPRLPVTNIIPPTPPRPELARVESDVPSETTAPVPIPARRWFSPVSSIQSRSPEAELRPISPLVSPQAGVGSPRTPSSIDEQVPKLPSAGPSLESVSPPVVLSTDSSQNLSPLNPSASRFSLSIPFLGRPKVPLDRAMASAQASDIRTEPDIPISSNDGAEAEKGESTALETSKNLSVDTSSTPLTGPNSDLAVSDGATAQGTWWGLVGWRSTTSDMHETSPIPDPTPNGQPDQDLAAVSADTETFSNTDAHLQTLHGLTLSVDTPQGQGSSWLSPWSWYGQSTPTPAPGMAQPQPESGGAGVKAETERPKTAEAEAEVVLGAPVEHDPTSATHVELTNPIQSSIKTNISGWTSFFSSKSLLAKRITDTEHREEDGMEVMDVDEGDDERGSTATSVVTSDARAGKDPAGREMRVPRLAPAPPRTPSPSPRPKAKPDDPKGTTRTSVSPVPSKGSGRASPRVPPPPNLVLPTWDDTFLTSPRSTVPRAQTESALAKTVRFVSGMLFAKEDGASTEKGKARSRDDGDLADFGGELPRIWDILGESERLDGDVLRGCKRVVVIGIHGWFPGAVMRTVLGEPTGTSNKFVTMMCQALEVFQEQHGVQIEKVTQIPLEGEGTISKRVEKLYSNLTANPEWINDLHAADAILVATHSQGSIVSTHLLDRLIHEKHIKTSRTLDLLASASAALAPGGTSPPAPSAQRVCCLALCGIHLGPLRYLSSSSLVQPYIQYFESAAAKEIFEFQNTNSEVSKAYVRALRNVVDHGVKMVYIASLNDQVVPLYSGLFTAASHPLILRALYIDGDAYHSSDFLSNLLVLLLRVMNVGLSDSGLLTHLSEATAGSLNGIGHSKAYEELATFSLAVNYLFLTNHGSNEHPELVVQPFDVNTELNDYEIPWALRDLIANEGVTHFFANDFANLRNAFPDWHPKTAILRDIKRKLQPIQRLNTTVPIVVGSSTL